MRIFTTKGHEKARKKRLNYAITTMMTKKLGKIFMLIRVIR